METITFYEWLLNVKKMSTRSAKDVQSRLKRVERLVGVDTIDNNTLELLLNNEQYKSLSMFIKSQLKRTIALVLEYQEKMNE